MKLLENTKRDVHGLNRGAIERVNKQVASVLVPLRMLSSPSENQRCNLSHE